MTHQELDMPTLPPSTIAHLLQPYLEGTHDVPMRLYDQLAIYLDLLTRWNVHTNLTAIRSPDDIVRRHFGESLFAARHLPPADTLLDLGSGAGLPGLPIQLLHPHLSVTLAESQNKKASFLREVIRTLDLPTQVWPRRAEMLPLGTAFDLVALRAVDRMQDAVTTAQPLASRALVLLTTTNQSPAPMAGFADWDATPVPGSNDGVLLTAQRVVAPSGRG